MKIGIITHYDVHNHGALLQLNALIKVLKDKGIEACALQFDKNYDFMGVGLKAKYDISIKSVGIYARYLCEKGIRRTLFNICKGRILKAFRHQEGLVGEYYSEAKDIDATIIGSDEVFALHTGPTPVFFGYACPGKKVFAYAGSFGPTNFDDIVAHHCLTFVSSGLNVMTGISVRDKNSQEIVARLLGRSPALVCDPVLLYGYERERKAFGPLNLPRYLLVYAYDNNMNACAEVAEIKLYARKRGLKIISAGFYHKWCDRNINVDPVELLNYFVNAACIVTDTFHGSVMSILAEGNFAVRTRNNSNKLHNLLSEYNLTNRIISKAQPMEQILSEKIDYCRVHAELIRRREESMAYLDSMIQL